MLNQQRSYGKFRYLFLLENFQNIFISRHNPFKLTLLVPEGNAAIPTNLLFSYKFETKKINMD